MVPINPGRFEFRFASPAEFVPRLIARDQFADSVDQPIGVIVKINARIQGQSITEREPLERWRQRIWSRHRRVVYQQRNNWNAATGSVFEFQTNNVDRIIDSARSVALFAEPARPDDGNHQTRALDCFLDLLPEIDARRN